MRRVILLGLLVLAACAGPATGPVGFRDPEAPIWSAAAFAPSRIAGTWQEVAHFAAEEAGCRSGGLSFEPAASGLRITGSLCLQGKVARIDTEAGIAGPGRLSPGGQEEWWVLWVDEGYRTLAIGTPSGRFGFVLDRGAGAADRLTAAREVLDFNGYDTRYLRRN
jgi:apolipoprotein D and lipocalin family protein